MVFLQKEELLSFPLIKIIPIGNILLMINACCECCHKTDLNLYHYLGGKWYLFLELLWRPVRTFVYTTFPHTIHDYVPQLPVSSLRSEKWPTKNVLPYKSFCQTLIRLTPASIKESSVCVFVNMCVLTP